MNLADPSGSNDIWSCFNNPNSTGRNKKEGNKTFINRRRDEQDESQHGLEDSALNKLLNEKLTQMSLEERSSGVDEIHGVSEVKETPEMIENGIKEMNQTLNRMVLDDGGEFDGNGNDGEHHKSGKQLKLSSLTYHYRLALVRSSEYVELLKVSCLRAERYNGSKAALRLVRFFERKAALFGEESLARDLEFERDLGEDEQEAMSRGLFQVLPHRDRSGRAILFYCRKNISSHYSTDTLMRCMMYICTSCALQDLETQKRGVVMIGYVLGQQSAASGGPAAFIQHWQALPLFTSAYHACMNTSMMIMPLYILCSYLENNSISRFKIHTGTPVECIYNLMTYGIPKDVIPINVTDGSVDLTFQHIMLDTLKRIEKTKREKSQQQSLHHASTMESQPPPSTSTISASSVTTMMPTTVNNINMDLSDSETVDMSLEAEEEQKREGKNDLVQQSVPGVRSGSNTKAQNEKIEPEKELILIPGPMDIIMGKGRRPKSRPGSLRLHNLMLQYREQYDKSSKSEKTDLANVILNEVKKAGCRFLTIESSSSSSSSSSSDTMDKKDIMDNDSNNNKSTIYVECDDATARLRIAHGFRNIRSRAQKRQQQHPKSSSDEEA